jgi:RNA polymerase sigma-70 factor (ECF subfamily)
LIRSIHSVEALEEFGKVRERVELFGPFGEPMEIVGFLARAEGDPEAKDRLLRQAVAIIQGASPGKVVSTILLLGLWPGLDALFNRRICLFRDQADDFGAEIVHGLLREARGLQLKRVNRVAATLVRNTERRLLETRARDAAVVTEPSEVSSVVERVSSVGPTTSPMAFPGVSGALSDDESVEALRAWLRSVVGDDGDVVADSVLLGRTCFELADELGLTPATVRKRLQRALERARRAIEGRNRRSQFPGKAAFVGR